VEVKKVDKQGRFILPADWRQAELNKSRELYVIKRKGYLKIIPKHHVDLTENFDKADLAWKPSEAGNNLRRNSSVYLACKTTIAAYSFHLAQNGHSFFSL